MSKFAYIHLPSKLISPIPIEDREEAIRAGFRMATKKQYEKQMKAILKLEKIAHKHKIPVSKFLELLRDEKWLEANHYSIIKKAKTEDYYLVANKRIPVLGKQGYTENKRQYYKLPNIYSNKDEKSRKV